MFVLGMGEPSVITRPSVWPRIVSTQTWQSTPAVKPGPTPITSGASVMAVPRLRLARIASTSASGRSAFLLLASGSARTAMSPLATMASASLAFSARRAVTSSTVAVPKSSACEKQTVRRMAVGLGRSVMTI